MNILSDVLDWFADPSHWSGSGGVPIRVLQHVELSLVAVGLGVAVGVPVGLVIGHTRRGEFVAVSMANLGRAIPSFAILSIVFQLMLNYTPTLAFGFWPTVVALWLLAIPPILTNTYVGVQTVEADTVEAARGMGMTGPEVLAQLEVPLATPLILAGIRTAAVQVVATATLAALIAGGGLGRFIVDGFHTRDDPQIVAGALLVAVLAILTEVSFGLVERALSPRTTSRAGGRRGARAWPAVSPGPPAA